MRGTSSMLNFPNSKKKERRFKKAKGAMRIGKNDLEGLLMKSKDIIGAL